MKKLLLLSFVLASSLWLAGCGQTCFGGFAGKCDSQNNPPPTNNFSITPQVAGVYRDTIRIGEVMTLKPTGGRPEYYPREVRPPGCADINSANLVTVPLVPGPCTLLVVDSSVPTQTASLTITILPRQ